MTKTNQTTTTEIRELLYATNNAYDTVLLVEGGKVLGEWGVTPEIATNYLNPGDLSDWDETYPNCTDPSDYGDILSPAEARERIADYHLPESATLAEIETELLGCYHEAIRQGYDGSIGEWEATEHDVAWVRSELGSVSDEDLHTAMRNIRSSASRR